MTKTIILARHSYAENGSFNTKDFDRELTTQGINFAKQQGIKFSNYAITPDIMISSDAKRALQTSEILKEQLSYSKPIDFQHFLYRDYTTQDFINFIHLLNDELNSALIVGHNPTLATIAYRLSTNFNHGVNPGSIIILEFECNTWKEINAGEGRLIDIIA